VQLFN